MKKPKRKNLSSETAENLRSQPPRGVTQYHAWYNHLGLADAKKRQYWCNVIIEALEERAKEENDKSLLSFSKLLRDKSKCKIIGLQPYIEYTRIKGEQKDLEPNFLHAWGSPVMVCVLKGLPAVVIVGSDFEWSDQYGFMG